MALFNPLSSGAIKQYSADDISAPATSQRKWWSTATSGIAKQPAMSQPAEDKPETVEPPKFTTLTNIKNPKLDEAQSQLFTDFNKNRDTGATLFNQYLTEAQNQAQQNKADLAKQRKAYDLTDFTNALTANRANQESLLGQARDNAVKFAAGNVERTLLGSGLPTSGSSELQATAAREFAQAALPYEQQLAQGRAQDLNRVEDLTLQTAGGAAAANRNYLANLLLPAQAGSELFRANAGNLGALQALDQQNRFYGLYTPYQNRVPVTPIPLASGYVPAIPNYRQSNQVSYTPSAPVAGRFQFGAVGGTPRSAAEEAYRSDTGYYPQEDPNFNSMLYESYGGRLGQTPQQRASVAQAVAMARQPSVEAGAARAADVWERRRAADAAYQRDTGFSPNEDPNYNETLWRSYYNGGSPAGPGGGGDDEDPMHKRGRLLTSEPAALPAPLSGYEYPGGYGNLYNVPFDALLRNKLRRDWMLSTPEARASMTDPNVYEQTGQFQEGTPYEPVNMGYDQPASY